MCTQFVSQKAGSIKGKRAVKSGVRYAGRLVMVRDCLHRKMGKSPKSEQVCPDLRMRSSKYLLLGLERLASAFPAALKHSAKLIGQLLCNNQPSNVLKKRSQDDLIPNLYIYREHHRDGCRRLGLLLDPFDD